VGIVVAEGETEMMGDEALVFSDQIILSRIEDFSLEAMEMAVRGIM
jgi:hypothetical protein